MKNARGWTAAVAVAAMLCAAGPAGSAPPEMSLATMRLQTRLEKVISCSFDHATLTEALDFFRAQLGINIVVDAPGRNLDDVAITLKLKDVNGTVAMRWTLRQAALAGVAGDGILYVATAQRARELEQDTMYLKLYDVTDLLGPPMPNQVNQNNNNNASGGTTK